MSLFGYYMSQDSAEHCYICAVKRIVIMYKALTDISIEHLLEQDIPELVGYNNDIVMTSNLSDMRLFSHPARMKATTVLICLHGEIDCSINLKRFRITENHLLVNFSGDIIQIHSTDNIAGYVLMLSEDYLQQLQIDFRLRAQSYIGLRGNGPIQVPYEELAYLKPYHTLLRKNMEDGNPDVIKGLAHALSYTILSMVRRFQKNNHLTDGKDTPRAQQIFDKFMTLLHMYHDRERSIQFYADKMCLTPKYISGMIKTYSGKCALDWINDYVVIEAKMMLRYTTMTVQEISNSLNFPTQSAFGKYFKQQVGVGPKQYRNECVM
jgi:transcriptional regulator